MVKLEISHQIDKVTKPKADCKKNLLDNLIQGTSEKKTDFKCESCGKTFLSKAHLNRHISFVHQVGKKFICESCGNSFACKAYLNIHINRVHLKKKEHKCSICKWNFYFCHNYTNI